MGDTVRGKVCRAAQFGVFVELLPGVEGLCHRSEIVSEPVKRRGAPVQEEEPLMPVGQEMDFKIIKMNEAQKRIGLSIKARSEDEEQLRLKDYQRQAAVATSTMGDVIRQREPEEKE